MFRSVSRSISRRFSNLLPDNNHTQQNDGTNNNDTATPFVCEDLSITPQAEFASVACDQNLDSFLSLVSLVAPAGPQRDLTQQRAGIDLAVVLDRSGSMAGEKMKMVHKTTTLLIQHLHPNDRLAIVAYDDKVETSLPLTTMDQAGKKKALHALKSISDRGSTNLSGGLLEGLDVLAKRTSKKNEISSVLLLTDGLANVGITDKPQIVSATRKKVAGMKNPTSYTFGFGNDHDASLLSQIAEVGRGNYYFMKTADSIPQAFADCIGGLMSVLAQNIELTITAAPGIVINSVETSFNKTENQPNNKYTVSVGDIFAEERKDFLVDVRLPATAEPVEAQPLATIELRYLDVASVTTKSLTIVASVKRTGQGDANGSVSSAVDEQRNRVKTAKAMEEAIKLGDSGRLDEARSVLLNCQRDVELSASGLQCAGLVQDMGSAVKDMSSRSQYENVGSKKLNSKARKHWVQRSAECDAEEGDMYSNNMKSLAKAGFM